jgi:hypothetical protein
MKKQRCWPFLIVLVVVLALLACKSSDFTIASTNADTQSVSTGNSSSDTGPHTVNGSPTISIDFINQVLCKYDSPLCRSGQALYDDGKLYGIDPAYALAFFWNESNFGRAGEARASKSIGNLRCLDHAHYGDLGTWCQDGYAWFPTWRAGIIAFYRLLAGPLYRGAGLVTVEQIIPRYAPSADHNSPERYIAVVNAAVSLWRDGQARVP